MAIIGQKINPCNRIGYKGLVVEMGGIEPPTS